MYLEDDLASQVVIEGIRVGTNTFKGVRKKFRAHRSCHPFKKSWLHSAIREKQFLDTKRQSLSPPVSPASLLARWAPQSTCLLWLTDYNHSYPSTIDVIIKLTFLEWEKEKLKKTPSKPNFHVNLKRKMSC